MTDELTPEVEMPTEIKITEETDAQKALQRTKKK